MKPHVLLTFILFICTTLLSAQDTSSASTETKEKGYAKLKGGTVIPLGNLTDLEFQSGVRVEIGADVYTDFLPGAYITGDLFYSNMKINENKLIERFTEENKTLQPSNISNQTIFGCSFGVGYDLHITKNLAISPQINYSSFIIDIGGVSEAIQNDNNGRPLYIETYDDFLTFGMGLRPGITAKWFFSEHVGIGITADVDLYLYFDNKYKEVTYLDPSLGPRYPDSSFGFGIEQSMTTNILGVLYIKIPDSIF